MITACVTYEWLKSAKPFLLAKHYLMGLGPNQKKIPQNSGKQIRIPEGVWFNSLLSIKSQNVGLGET